MSGKTRIIKGHVAQAGNIHTYEREVLEHVLPETAAAVEEEETVDTSEVLAQAQAEAERIMQEAYEEGMRQGLEAGRAQFEQSVAHAATAVEQAAQEVQRAYRAFLESLEPQVVTLAHSIATRILQREAQMDRELVVRTVRSALELMSDRARVTVRMNPTDHQALREHRPELLEAFEGITQIDLIPDSQIGLGGCVAESDTLVVDATLHAQLTRILNELRGNESPAS